VNGSHKTLQSVQRVRMSNQRCVGLIPT
jgi:hypothetical protein